MMNKDKKDLNSDLKFLEEEIKKLKLRVNLLKYLTVVTVVGLFIIIVLKNI